MNQIQNRIQLSHGINAFFRLACIFQSLENYDDYMNNLPIRSRRKMWILIYRSSTSEDRWLFSEMTGDAQLVFTATTHIPEFQ